MQITRKEIEDIITTIDNNGILFIDAEKPLWLRGHRSTIHYLPNEINRDRIINILCEEYGITK